MMELEKHPTDEQWRERLARLEQRRVSLFASAPSADDARYLAEDAFERALIACKLDLESEAAEAFAAGAGCGAAAVLQRAMPEGSVLLHFPDGAERSLPADDVALSPTFWLRSVSCALVARDRDSLDILCDPAHIQAAERPLDFQDAFWPPLCTAIASVVRKDFELAQLKAHEAEFAITSQAIEKADLQVAQKQIAPLLAILMSLTPGNIRLSGAFQTAIAAHAEYFSAAGAWADPYKVFPLEALGLAALAHDRELLATPKGLPENFVRGEFPQQRQRVTFRYASRSLEFDDDATAFLDLEGFSRRERNHAITERDGKPFAFYEAHGKPGVPHTIAEFALDSESTLPRALDTGERLLIAELYANWAGLATEAGDKKQAAAWLSQAVEAMDRVISKCLPNEAITAEAFTNERGRIEYYTNPDRFRRDRLVAYRSAIQKSLWKSDELGSAADLDPYRTSALRSADVIKEALRPLLEALGKDKSSRIRERLRPQPEDFAKVFTSNAVEQARKFYQTMWRTIPDMKFPSSSQEEVQIFVASAGLLLEKNELSQSFPEGYRAIAHWLQPHRVWVCWKFVSPGESSGLAFDGFVWCDDHWAWMPKPYRALQSLADTANRA